MIKNVNLMQNPLDITWDENSEFSKEYIVQALANLGQRIGIKGDSIAYKSFTFNDILTQSYASSDYIGFIEYFKDDTSNDYKAKFGVTDKYNLYNSNLETVVDISGSINDSLVFDNGLSFSMQMNGVDRYAKNSICISHDGEFTIMTAGKLVGTDDNDPNNAMLIYYKFNIDTNKPICGYKVFYAGQMSNGDDIYCLLALNNERTLDSLTDTYYLDIYMLNMSVLDEQSMEGINMAFKFSSYENGADVPFTIIKNEYVDLDQLLGYSANEDTNYESNSIVSVILNNINNLTEQRHKKIRLTYDTQKNELYSDGSDESLSTALEFFFKEYDLNLNEEIFMINEDITNLYINMFRYYNEKMYLEYKSTFIKRILFKIYERSSEYDYSTSYRMYIPLNYTFHYICNSNNDLNIYYSTNIYVTYTSLKSVDINEFWDLNTNIIFDYNGIEKVKVYNFEITYNNANEDIINSVDIKDIYTMPYINASNNWSINDIDTKIRAIGKDAGNPNIIVVMNKNKNDYEVMNAVSNKKPIEECKFERQWFNINTALFNNIDDINIRACAYIPEVTDLTYEYFKDSIIFSISGLDCLEYDIYKTDYKGSYIYTIWHVTENNGKLKFTILNDENNLYALTLGSTINTLVANNDKSVANLNDMDLILLKSIITNVAQERLGTNNNNWLIIKNKHSEEYATEMNLKTNEYNNDLNAIMQYNDNVSMKSNYVIHNQVSKYIPDITDINISNALYPKYSYTTETVTKSVQLAQLSTYNEAIQQRSTVIYANGKQVTNIESLIEKLGEQETIENVEKELEVQVKTINKTGSKYNEYIFDTNIPSLDCKEMFVRNINALNRLNVVSLDSNGMPYNAYIGTSFNETDKSTLHIGSTATNINVGSDTLINEIDRNKFGVHKTVSVDFNTIKLNSTNKIVASTPVLYEYEYGGITFTMTNIKLIGELISVPVNGPDENWSNYVNNLNGMFAKDNNSGDYYISLNYIFDTYFSDNHLDTKLHNAIMINGSNVTNDNKDIVRKGKYTDTSNESTYLLRVKNVTKLSKINTYYSSCTLELMFYESSYIENNREVSGINIYATLK